MQSIISIIAAVWLLLPYGLAAAEPLRIAAAANMKFALDEIVTEFRRAWPEERIDVVYGASAKLNAQIQQGAPYDLYFAADLAYPQALVDAGLAAPKSGVRTYARGRLVLWSARLPPEALQLESLTDARIQRIAIANPRHAPYGQRAVEAFKSAGVWEQLEARLVYGENISQAAQFVQTGNAQVGVLALSLVLSPELLGVGHYLEIPESLHTPLEQGYILTRRAAGNPLVQRFVDHFDSAATAAVLRRHGFVLPASAHTAKSDDAD